MMMMMTTAKMMIHFKVNRKTTKARKHEKRDSQRLLSYKSKLDSSTTIFFTLSFGSVT